MLRPYLHVFRREGPFHDFGCRRILARQQPVLHVHDGDMATESRECLGQLAADGTTSQHQQTGREGVESPQVLGGQYVDRIEARYRRHEGSSACREDDSPGGHPLALDRHGVPVKKFRIAGYASHAKGLIALRRVFRRYGRDGLPHSSHDRLKVDAPGHIRQSVPLRGCQCMGGLRRCDKRLGRNATGVQAIAAHRAALDQRNAGTHRRSNQCGDQTARSRADYDEIVVIDWHRPAP